MAWDGRNRTQVGAGFSPLGRTIGMAVYGLDLFTPPPPKETRRLRRALKHRRLLCFRKQRIGPDVARRFVLELGVAGVGGSLAAPANGVDGDGVSFVDRDLLARMGDAMPDFTYRHFWQEGDVLVWSRRLALHG